MMYNILILNNLYCYYVSSSYLFHKNNNDLNYKFEVVRIMKELNFYFVLFFYLLKTLFY